MDILRNPVPTAGEVRIARSRSEPVLSYLRWVAYFGLGVGLAGVSIRSLRSAHPRSGAPEDRSAFPARMAEHGETALDGMRSNPAVNRVTTKASTVRDDLATKVEGAVDEAHDVVEEIYGRSYAWLADLRRKLPTGRLGDRRGR